MDKTKSSKDSATRFSTSGLFFLVSFPQAPEYAIRAISIFFENSRRFLQLKVHHRTQVSLTPVANGKNLQSEHF